MELLSLQRLVVESIMKDRGKAMKCIDMHAMSTSKTVEIDLYETRCREVHATYLKIEKSFAQFNDIMWCLRLNTQTCTCHQ